MTAGLTRGLGAKRCAGPIGATGGVVTGAWGNPSKFEIIGAGASGEAVREELRSQPSRRSRPIRKTAADWFGRPVQLAFDDGRPAAQAEKPAQKPRVIIARAGRAVPADHDDRQRRSAELCQ